jgi:hypothetical protein
MITQEQWDNLFINKYPNQPTPLYYMKEEIKFIIHILKNKNINCTEKQAIIFWEEFSDSMDAGWMSGDEQYVLFTIEETLKGN